jgi:quinol monooxygenase YgiN
MNRISRWGLAVATFALVFGGSLFTGHLSAQEVDSKGELVAPKDPSPLYVVIFADFTPDNIGKGTELIKQYTLDTKKDPGNVRSELLAQSNRPNHFMIQQVWKNTTAFEAHEESQHTKDFRAKAQPMLGAPFDERLHFKVE